MKRLLMLGSALLLAHLEAAAPALPRISEQGNQALSTFLKAAVARGDVPGVVALVVNHEETLYQGGFGKLNVAGNIDMPTDAIFRIASMTKPMTSVAVMMLFEEGKLGLDDEVSKYLPAFKGRPVIARFNDKDGTYETRPASRAITIRHLLTHTSGIGYGFTDPRLFILTNKTRLVETELPLLHDPGEKWSYGASTRVLGDVVAKISGQPIDVFLKARILDPLGLRDTSYDVPAAKVDRLATSHQRTGGKLTEQPNPSTPPVTVRGDGGLYSTARDYGVFLQMLLNEGRLGNTKILTPRSVRLMTQNQIGKVVVQRQPDADTARTRPFPIGAGFDKFGLGFQIAVQTGPNLRSAGSYSWAGINNTHFWVDPNKQIGVVLLMQVLPFYDENAIGVLRGFEQAVYRHLN